MTYYTIKDGEITASADWAFEEGALETEREIVRGRDGKLYFEGEEPLPAIEITRMSKLAEVLNEYSKAFSFVEAIYPAAEREGWFVQEAEARAVLADPNAETPVLSILITLRGRGETVIDLAKKVMENSSNWRELYSYLTGQQQRMYAEVSSPEQTVEGILAYVVSYDIPSNK